jgi:hypothetical protein
MSFTSILNLSLKKCLDVYSLKHREKRHSFFPKTGYFIPLEAKNVKKKIKLCAYFFLTFVEPLETLLTDFEPLEDRPRLEEELRDDETLPDEDLLEEDRLLLV